jgi:hypothetical protein
MRMRMLGAVSAATALVAGCGASGGYDNAERPPAPINVAVSVNGDRVSVSPHHVGAGPVVLLVSNASGTTRDVTLSGPSGGACVEANASSGPIDPQGVARLQIELVQGDCVVGVRDGSLRPARLSVGPTRNSAQDSLLQP